MRRAVVPPRDQPGSFGEGLWGDSVVAMVLMQVQVPEGLVAGDAMSVSVRELEFTLTVPEGCGAGDTMEVDLPIDDEPVPPQETVLITIPAGLVAGDPFSVTTDWGGEFEIVVPDGCNPGETIEVTLPLPAPAAETEQPALAPAATTEHTLPPGYNPDDFLFKPGQRVELYRTGDAYSGGTIVYGWEGWDGAHYKVELDGGMIKEAVPEDEISGATADVGDLFEGF